MYKCPSETEMYIRDYEESHARDIQMADAYCSPPGSPLQEYKPSSPNYSAQKSSYVQYQGAPAYHYLPSSPAYTPPQSGSSPSSPTSPVYNKAPDTQDKYIAEAELFKETMLEFESGTTKASAPKPAPVVSNTSKDDARWSLMKYKDGMPIKDLATGLEYYTDSLCDQEQTVQETEIGLQRRVDEMKAAATNSSYETFCKKYDIVERFQEKLKTQIRGYLGAAKLLEANLVIRNEIREPVIIFQAEAAIAEASKLKDGLLESANKADELMDIAYAVAEAMLRREDLEAAVSFDEVDEMVTDSLSDADEDAEHEEDDETPWIDEEMNAGVERAFDKEAAEEAEKLAALGDDEVVDSTAAFFAKINAVKCPGKFHPNFASHV